VKSEVEGQFTITYWGIYNNEFEEVPTTISVLKQSVKGTHPEYLIDEWRSSIDLKSETSSTTKNEMRCLQISGQKLSVKRDMGWMDQFKKQAN